jgi:hypothetical protein
MPERASLTQGVQVGVEVTPGTTVAANKKFISIGIESAIKIDPQRFRPMGQKFASQVVPGKEWVEANIDGVGSYTEVIWFLSSLLVTPSAPATLDTSAKKWTFTPSATAEDTVKTLTVEQGGVVRAHKFGYGLVTELEFKFNRDTVAISGSMIGQRITDSITLTAGPTTPPEVPIIPTEVDVYVDPTSGALGTTKLTRCLEATVSIGDRFNPVWVLNSANTSFVAHVENEPKAEAKLLLEADSVGMGILTNMRAGSTQFLRVLATSATLAGATTQKYSLQIDAAIKVKDVSDFSDEDGVYAIEWTFEIVYDTTWTKAIEVQVVNKETTL